MKKRKASDVFVPATTRLRTSAEELKRATISTLQASASAEIARVSLLQQDHPLAAIALRTVAMQFDRLPRASAVVATELLRRTTSVQQQAVVLLHDSLMHNKRTKWMAPTLVLQHAFFKAQTESSKAAFHYLDTQLQDSLFRDDISLLGFAGVFAANTWRDDRTDGISFRAAISSFGRAAARDPHNYRWVQEHFQLLVDASKLSDARSLLERYAATESCPAAFCDLSKLLLHHYPQDTVSLHRVTRSWCRTNPANTLAYLLAVATGLACRVPHGYLLAITLGHIDAQPNAAIVWGILNWLLLENRSVELRTDKTIVEKPSIHAECHIDQSDVHLQRVWMGASKWFAQIHFDITDMSRYSDEVLLLKALCSIRLLPQGTARYFVEMCAAELNARQSPVRGVLQQTETSRVTAILKRFVVDDTLVNLVRKARVTEHAVSRMEDTEEDESMSDEDGFYV